MTLKFYKIPMTQTTKNAPTTIKTEQDLLNQLRLNYSATGARLWRNNVGAYYDQRNHLIRYGLANESKKINDQLKSADLIGIRPIKITEQDIGRTIGQFVSIEVKRPKQTLRIKKAQTNWRDLIQSLGGEAKIINHETNLHD